MIIDRITNVDLYSSLSPRIKRAFDYIQQTDLAALAVGKYEIDGENLFVIVQEYTTKPKDRSKWEAHRRYIDVQYIIRGTEQIGYTHVGSLSPTGAHDVAKDIRFFSGDGDFLTLPEGTFMLLLPKDAHMPGIAVDAPSPVKKAVFKISAA
jgi:YhcH/YjgK/YiaL family protein